MDWDDLKIILTIGREGSLSGAAKVLGSSHSTVFRQINAIESKLGVRFFNRLPNGYEMTEAGETVLRRAGNIEEDILSLEREIMSKDLRLQGNIRVTAPEDMANYLLIPHIASFNRKYPEIKIDLIVSSQDLQLSRHEADLAIRTTTTPPPSSIGNKVSDYKIAIYAAESYLERSKGREVTEFDYVLFNNGINWFAPSYWKAGTHPNVVFQCDSIQAVVKAAKQGIGAAVLPCIIGEQEPQLKRVTPPFIEASELWLLTHADLRQTTRVKALMTHLHECLSKEKPLMECTG